jgi:SOS-response transcriptional repressor LexA
MWIKKLDFQVLETLKELIFNDEKISTRKISRILWMEKSLRSVQLSIERLKRNWKIFTNKDWKLEITKDLHLQNIKTKLIPLIWVISCWWPILAEEFIEDYIPISEDLLKSSYEYFLLKTTWDSMNEKWINPWDTILIKQTNTCNNWDIVVALVDDEVTLKEFKKENWVIKLIPHSTNPDNKTFIITENLIIQWVYQMNLGKI